MSIQVSINGFLIHLSFKALLTIFFWFWVYLKVTTCSETFGVKIYAATMSRRAAFQMFECICEYLCAYFWVLASLTIYMKEELSYKHSSFQSHLSMLHAILFYSIPFSHLLNQPANNNLYHTMLNSG